MQPHPRRRRSKNAPSRSGGSAPAGPASGDQASTTPGSPPPAAPPGGPPARGPALIVDQPDGITTVEQLLAHFEQLEIQLQQVREGLTHSHRLATLGTIASIIAHEYNNILTPVVSYAQLALASPGDHALLTKAVEKALAGAEKAAHISSSLLGFAREADQQHVANLPKTIEESVTCLAREPRKDGIELTVDVPGVLVAINPLNLQQVFLNLLLNARQAMRRMAGKIRIAARIEGTLVHIDVADTGPGIPEQIRDRLFEPFATHRADVESASGGGSGGGPERKGTGLGLCICRDLIRDRKSVV
jgi:signal transduction histidine kinase